MAGVEIVPRPGVSIELDGARRLDYDEVSVARLTPSPAPAYGLARVGRDTPKPLGEPAKVPLAKVAVVAQAPAEVPVYDGWQTLEVIR